MYVGDLDNYEISKDKRQVIPLSSGQNAHVSIPGISTTLIETMQIVLKTIGYQLGNDQQQVIAEKQQKPMQGFCADDFKAVSSYIAFSDWCSIRFKVCDEFSIAIRGGDFSFMLVGNPTEIDSDADVPMANNARQIAEAIGGYECYFNPNSDELDVAFNGTDLHKILVRNTSQELADACHKLMQKPKP